MKNFRLDLDLEGEDKSCIINKSKISEFFQFLKEKATYFSLEYYYDGKVSKEELKYLQKECQKNFEKQIRAYLHNENGYRDTLKHVLGIQTEKEAKRYFKNMKKSYKEDIIDEIRHQRGYCKRISEEEMLKRGMTECRLTCNTPSTLGSTRMIYYFPANHLKDAIPNMKTLYDYIYIDSFQFENPTFYNGTYENEEYAFYVTTTHEKDASLSISKKEFEMLTNAKILKLCQ